MSNRVPFAGFRDHVAAIDMMRVAAALRVSNRAFRDRNSLLYTGTVLGPDGLTWNRSVFRDWFYYGTGGTPGDPYGSYAGAKRPAGAYGPESIYMSTTSVATGESIATDHRVLGRTIFSAFIPFQRYFQAHYEKPITLALVTALPTDVVIGTNLKAYLGCYGADGLYDGVVEIVFDNAGAVGTGAVYQRLTGRTTVAMPSTTYWVQVHIGISSPDGVSTPFEFSEVSLMLNPENESRAVDASPVQFIDIADLHVQAGAGFQFEAIALDERMMMDGRRIRTRVIRDNLRYAFQANFGRAMSDERMRQLLTIWNLTTRGLGYHVPSPVPVCVDFGLGTGPFFAPYWIEGSAAAVVHFPGWTLASQKFDVSMTFREA